MLEDGLAVVAVEGLARHEQEVALRGELLLVGGALVQVVLEVGLGEGVLAGKATTG